VTHLATLPFVRTIKDAKRGKIDFAALIEAGEPTVLKAVAADLPLADYLYRIRAGIAGDEAPSVSLGSTDVGTFFAGLCGENPVVAEGDLPGSGTPPASLWIGNRTTVAAHWGMSNNIACPGASGRRFTVFPPNQVANLYPGPLEPTPGGQVACARCIGDAGRQCSAALARTSPATSQQIGWP